VAAPARHDVEGRTVWVHTPAAGEPAAPPGAWKKHLWRALETSPAGAELEVHVDATERAGAKAWCGFRASWPALLAGTRRSRDPRLVGAVELARREAPLARLVAASGPPTIPQRPSTFATLARAIAYQQLSGKAAATIWGRVMDLVGGRDPEARELLRRRPATLRAAGLSHAKVAAVRDLAAHVLRGDVQPNALPGLADEEVVERLTRVRGIGRWSAQMHLIFSLGRLDVWPTGDLGVRKGYALWRGLTRMPTEKELGPLGEAYRPYRSLAAWYAWRAIDIGFP